MGIGATEHVNWISSPAPSSSMARCAGQHYTGNPRHKLIHTAPPGEAVHCLSLGVKQFMQPTRQGNLSPTQLAPCQSS